jgi:hypothetical protein
MQDFRKGNEDGARAADNRAERELAALRRRSDWDNPSGDEPSVPIIYEPS